MMQTVNRIGQGVLLGILSIIVTGTAGVLIYTTSHGFALVGSVYMVLLSMITAGLAIWTNRHDSNTQLMAIKLSGSIVLFTLAACSWATLYEAVDAPLKMFAVVDIALGIFSTIMILMCIDGLWNNPDAKDLASEESRQVQEETKP
ncbi:hypothetical protein ACI2KR_08275 [Pseudomonas luteola]